MSAESTAEVATFEESQVQDTVECDGWCGREVLESATIDVAWGADIGEYARPEPHLRMKGIHQDTPKIQQWCTRCAQDQSGIRSSAHGLRAERVRRYITAKTVAAFAMGFLLSLMLASIMAV